MQVDMKSRPSEAGIAEGGGYLGRAREMARRFFHTDRRATFAIEFALITPFLLMALLSCIDVGRLIYAHLKVQVTSNTIGDLISRSESSEITEALICSSLQAAELMLRPFEFDAGNSVTASSVTLTGGESGAMTVTRDWHAHMDGGDPSGCTVDDEEVDLGSAPMGLVKNLDEDEKDNIIHTTISFTHEAWFWSFLNRDETSPIFIQTLHRTRGQELNTVYSE